jgi:hypothetical protein
VQSKWAEGFSLFTDPSPGWLLSGEKFLEIGHNGLLSATYTYCGEQPPHTKVNTGTTE